jgi:hypothetical protein
MTPIDDGARLALPPRGYKYRVFKKLEEIGLKNECLVAEAVACPYILAGVFRPGVITGVLLPLCIYALVFLWRRE